MQVSDATSAKELAAAQQAAKHAEQRASKLEAELASTQSAGVCCVAGVCRCACVCAVLLTFVDAPVAFPPAEVVRGRLQDEVASLTQRVTEAETALAAAVESSTAAAASSAAAESRSKTLTAQVARLQQKLGAASRAARANRATLEKAEQTQALLVRNLRVLKKCLLLAEHRIRASYGPALPRYLSRAHSDSQSDPLLPHTQREGCHGKDGYGVASSRAGDAGTC